MYARVEDIVCLNNEHAVVLDPIKVCEPRNECWDLTLADARCLLNHHEDNPSKICIWFYIIFSIISILMIGFVH